MDQHPHNQQPRIPYRGKQEEGRGLDAWLWRGHGLHVPELAGSG